MKRLLTPLNQLMAFATLFAGLTLSAQEINKMRLGLNVSPSLNWLEPDNQYWENGGTKAGIAFGLNADFVLVNNDNYLFSTGFLLNYVGGKLDYPTAYNSVDSQGQSNWQATDAESNIRLRYLDVPLAIKLRTNEIGYLHYYGIFGSVLGFRIGAEENIDYTTINRSFSDVDIADDVNLLRSSLLIGAGLEYKISGNTYMAVGLTYQNGFTNILDGETYLTDDDGGIVISDSSTEPEKDQELKTRQNVLSLNITVFF